MSAAASIAVLDYGMGNIRSVVRAAQAAGATVKTIAGATDFDPGEFDGVVLPGQGHFGRCMDNLTETGLDRVVREWVERARPLLGICVGMQVLVDGSDEGGVDGLGIIRGRVKRVGGSGLRVPHMGWDVQTFPGASGLFRGVSTDTRYYYCHSYGIAPGSNPGSVETTCFYGVEFVAALEHSNVWATQFHPEKSSTAGIALWARFIDRSMCMSAEAAH